MKKVNNFLKALQDLSDEHEIYIELVPEKVIETKIVDQYFDICGSEINTTPSRLVLKTKSGVIVGKIETSNNKYKNTIK